MMDGQLVVLTGASGVGKTSIALAVERSHPEIDVFRFDTVGVPSAKAMAAYGSGHQPGGAWQRAITLQWIARIASLAAAGHRVLFEGQMRLAFIQEALAVARIEGRIVLVECSDTVRNARLTEDRLQPELANESMDGWSRYLHEEAVALGCEILDTTATPLSESVARVLTYLR